MGQGSQDRGTGVSPIETTRTFYELFANGRIEEMLARCVAPDAVLDNPLPAPIPFGGIYQGHQGFVTYAQQIFAGIQIELFEIDEIFAQDERVVVIGRERSRSLDTDKKYTMSWVHILTVSEGLVRHLREYNDTAAMAVAFA